VSDHAWYAKPAPTNTTSETRYQSDDEKEHFYVVRTTLVAVLTGELNFLLDWRISRISTGDGEDVSNNHSHNTY
jgi:hypothetical protein